MSYFVKRGQQVSGPYTGDQVKNWVNSGKLLGTDEISSSNQGPWKTIAQATQVSTSPASARTEPTPNIANTPTVNTARSQSLVEKAEISGGDISGKQVGVTTSRFEFTGTGGELLKELIVSFFLLVITFGFYGPWYVCRFQRWWTSKIKLVLSSGKKVEFDFSGTGGDFLVKYLVGYLLTLVTFGLYAPFFLVSLIQFFVDNTSGRTNDGKIVNLRFNGSGGQLFVNILVGYVLTIITFGIYFPWFYCSLIKWFTENTQADIEGLGTLNLSFTGRGESLLVTVLIGYLLTAITFGIYGFWCQVNIFKFLYGNTVVTTSNGKSYKLAFSGTGGENLLLTLKGVVLCFLTLGIYIFWFIVEQTKFQLENIESKST